MAKSKLMQELSIEELIDELNFFIPEIQREYVWGYNEREILDVFCEDLIEGKQSAGAIKDLGDKIAELSKLGKFEQIKELVDSKENIKPINIGFLYSYEPNYRMEHFPDSDLYKDVYLIDGQQRLTTLFILLFLIAIKEDRKEDFCKMFRFEEELEMIAFDYRVRNLTHNFFIDVVKNIQKSEDFSNIEESMWFLNEYSNDPTVRAVLKGFKIIGKHFNNHDDDFFDYLKAQVKFWHFKTEKTDQGEELYITMNSRGKQLEDSETVRAKLFEKIDKKDQLQRSEDWEKWQDFFWRYRNKNEDSNNADQGFNEFLKCIAGLESYRSKSGHFLDITDTIFPSTVLKFISLDKIEKYFDSLEYIYINKEKFKSKYNYSNWVDKCFVFVQKLFFEEKTNWFIDYNDEFRAKERMNMVFMWSVLDYMTTIDKNIDALDDIFRYIRVFWIRYNNHDRSVKTIEQRVQNSIHNGIWSNGISPDEDERHKFLNSIEDQKQLKLIESSLWRLEDHPLNINGYQVQNQNITHLVDFDKENTPEIIDEIYNKFIKLFDPEKPIGYKRFNTALLYYGFYGMKRKPDYYNNWDFSSWRRVIRDIDSQEMAFKNFFKDYNGNNLKEILAKKQNDFLKEQKENIENAVDKIECLDLITCIKLYALVIEDIWLKGRYIAESNYSPNNEFTTYETRALFNTKGDFRGYGHREFCYLVEESHENPIKFLKEKVENLI